MVIAPDAQVSAGANKASLVLQTSHQPGALYKALGVFAKAKINLTKLQSRPIVGKVWRYQFYVDVEAGGPKLHAVLAQLKAAGCRVALLGEYVAATKGYED